MSYRPGKSLGFPARAPWRQAVTPPTKQQIADFIRSAATRWRRYQRRMERLDIDGKAPRHIQQKARIAFQAVS